MWSKIYFLLVKTFTLAAVREKMCTIYGLLAFGDE